MKEIIKTGIRFLSVSELLFLPDDQKTIFVAGYSGLFSTVFGQAQSIVKSSDLFKRTDDNPHAGKVNIIEDPALDTLISRYILANKNQIEKNGYPGMEGFRIQIYSSSTRNPKKSQSKANQEFLTKFPESEYPN